jgi:hypothetical protein
LAKSTGIVGTLYRATCSFITRLCEAARFAYQLRIRGIVSLCSAIEVSIRTGQMLMLGDGTFGKFARSRAPHRCVSTEVIQCDVHDQRPQTVERQYAYDRYDNFYELCHGMQSGL